MEKTSQSTIYEYTRDNTWQLRSFSTKVFLSNVNSSVHSNLLYFKKIYLLTLYDVDLT